MTELRVIGHDAPRKDALEKVSGHAQYSTDVVLPGMLHAKVLRSPRGHARLMSIDVSRARALPGVHAVLTRDEVPKHLMAVYGYFIKDQPIVAVDKLRYEGDIVCAVAAETEGIAARALALIDVEYQDLPQAPTIEAALAPHAAELFEDAPIGFVPAYGTGASALLRPRKNVCYQFNYETGSPAAFERCDHVFEDEFRFSRMHHYHLEPFVTVADASRERIQVWSSCQNPFPLRKELARIFRLPENRITVQVPFVGGGFGAKNNCKTEPVAVLLSMLSGRPVRFCLTMEESFLTNTQHAAILRLKTGVMNDGRLVARASEIFLDSGAYSDASPLVAEKAGYRIPGPYRYEHIDTKCYCVMTNTAPAGPFRGFGGTQANWASESHIDMIARRLGIDPYAMRVKNFIRLGEPFVPGESAIDSDLKMGLDVVMRELGPERSSLATGKKRGRGVAIGFKDGGGVNKPAQARVKVSTGGDIFLHCGSVEIGQGVRTALTKIVAELLGAPLERVSYAAINTDYLPFDQGTNASSGVVVMGQAVAIAASKLRDEVLTFAAAQLDCAATDLELDNWSVRRGDQSHALAPMVMRYFGGTGFEFTAEGYYKAPLDHHAPLEAPCVFLGNRLGVAWTSKWIPRQDN